MDDIPVADLVTRAAAGDRAAWGVLVERFAPLVWSVCRRYRMSDADARDVAQTVWLRLLEHIADIRDPAALPGWLSTTVARECLQVLRAADRTAFTEVSDEVLAERSNLPTPEEQAMIAERNHIVRAAVAGLSERCRRLLALLAQDPPLAYVEIAELFGRPLGWVGPTRARCLAKLRQSALLTGLLTDGPELDREGPDR